MDYWEIVLLLEVKAEAAGLGMMKLATVTLTVCSHVGVYQQHMPSLSHCIVTLLWLLDKVCLQSNDA